MGTQAPTTNPKDKQQASSCCAPLDGEEQAVAVEAISEKAPQTQSGSCCAPLDDEQQAAEEQAVAVEAISEKAPQTQSGSCCAPMRRQRRAHRHTRRQGSRPDRRSPLGS